MQTFPPIPEWVSLEHQVAQILTQQELHGWYFNEQEARKLESALRRELLDYFGDNTLSLQERCSLLNEITGHKDT